MADAASAILTGIQNLPKQQTPIEVLTGWQDLTNKSLQGDYTKQATENAALENKRNTLNFNQTQVDYLGRQFGSQLSQPDSEQTRENYEKLINHARANGMIDDAHVASAFGQLPPAGSDASAFKRFGTRILIGSTAGPDVANRVLPHAVQVDRGPEILSGTQAGPSAGSSPGALNVTAPGSGVTKGVGPQMTDTGSGPGPTNDGRRTGPILESTLTPEQANQPETRIVNGQAITRYKGDWIQPQFRPQGWTSPNGGANLPNPVQPLGTGRPLPPAQAGATPAPVTPGAVATPPVAPATPGTPAPTPGVRPPNVMDPPAPALRPAPPTAAPPVPVADGGLGGGANTVPLTQEADTKAYTSALAQQPTRMQNVRNLQIAQDALRDVATGKGLDAVNKLRSLYVSTQGLAGIPPGVTAAQDKALDLANKYLTEYMRNSGAAGTSAAQLGASSDANASTHINHQAALEVITTNIGKERQAYAGVAEQPEKNGGTGFQAHSANHAATTDPHAFAVDRYTPEEYKAYVKSLKTDAEKDAFARGLAIAKRVFGIVPPGQIAPAPNTANPPVGKQGSNFLQRPAFTDTNLLTALG